MPFDLLSDIDPTISRWAITIIGLIFFLFLIARRRGGRNRAPSKSSGAHENIVVQWEDGPGGQITIEAWMETGAVKSVFQALTKDGKEARFVGGCVRDALSRRPINDIDIASAEPPERVVQLLEDAGIKVIPTGIEHGTVTAVAGGKAFQITSLRKDIKTDGRHAVVEYTDNWRLDAARRDFTFNTMSATPDGMVYDYFNGIQDLANRVINFVGLAEDRILEDRLRILRYFRFIAVLGCHIGDRFELQACAKHAPELKELSGERIRDELFKILDSDDPFDALKMMLDQGVMEHILPEASTTEYLKKLRWLETSAIKFNAVAPVRMRRLAALIETDGAGAENIAVRLRLSGKDKTHLKSMIEPKWDAGCDIPENKLRGILHRLGAPEVIDLMLLEWSRRLVATPRLETEESLNWQRVIALADAWEPVDFPISGQDVLDLGVGKGPRVSEILASIQLWWEENGCHAGRNECRTQLEALIKENF
ncbi:MAG: CCA tRNA nucleotidyltransferase [Rhodospirillales bacterium]|nr:CCA tRNA nucleotidyltransferase [Rhodospirillales bacterium]